MTIKVIVELTAQDLYDHARQVLGTTVKSVRDWKILLPIDAPDRQAMYKGKDDLTRNGTSVACQVVIETDD